MKIGIDIDDTLTDIKQELEEAAKEYAEQLGKAINSEFKEIDDKNNGNRYQEKYGFSYEELKYFLKEIQEEITNEAKPRENAKETIKKLKERGHQIYIITARDSEFHDNPYQQSKEWLDKNKIQYDKLIVNAREKASVCEQEKIDVFIDDQLNNCIAVSKIGIKTIRISTDKVKYENIITLEKWDEIYNKIIEME